MAVDDAHDADPAPVTPSDASPGPEQSPVGERAEDGRNEDADTRDEVRDPEAATRSREAANYRVRLREAEARLGERDAAIGALRSEVDRLHREEAERLAATSMAAPADLWLVAELADLRDDTGRLDVEKARAKIEAVVADRPAWKRHVPGFDGGARRTAPLQRTPGLSDLLKPGQAR